MVLYFYLEPMHIKKFRNRKICMFKKNHYYVGKSNT